MKYRERTPIRDRKYLDWLRTQRCILTGHYGKEYYPVDPMHIGTRGRSLKSSDDEALPVFHELHLKAHQKGEVSMLREHAPDSLLRDAFRALARELYQEYLKERQSANDD